MSEIDVSKCEYYNDYYKTCSNFSRFSDDEPYCYPKEFKCSFYINNIEKQLQQLKAENEDLKNELKMQKYKRIVVECGKRSFKNILHKYILSQQCLDEIEEICKVNVINTCWTALNLCDKCEKKEECGLQSPLAKLDAISNIIKQAKEN